MPKLASHPFTISIQTRPWMRGRFHWVIRQDGQVTEESPITHGTFEEARLDGKAVLDQMIVGWSRRVAEIVTGDQRRFYHVSPRKPGSILPPGKWPMVE